MHILFLMPVEPAQRERIAAVLPDDVLVSYDRQTAIAAARPVTAIIGGPSPETIEHLHQLDWVQFRSDSLEGWRDTLRLLAEREVVVTRTAGSYNATVPDHALMLILALARGLPQLLQRRTQRIWGGDGLRCVPLDGARVVIVGFGRIGRAVAERAVALGAEVTGVDPIPGELPAGVAAIVSPESLIDVVGGADFLVVCLPPVPSARGAVGAAVLAAMKRGAWLVNVGRGVTVDTDALLAALDSGRLAGAGLDVTDPSPLPADHPLWDHPKVILTCHTAQCGAEPEAAKFELILDNLKRYAEGRELRCAIDPRHWS